MKPDLDAIRAEWHDNAAHGGTAIRALLAYVDTLRAAVEHAEQRFVDEYDARKAAQREIVELKARIATLEAMKP